MEQYELLWKYQQVDMELDQYEKEMRGNSNRKELLKHRDFLLEQQGVLKKIESDVEIMSDRMEALADEIERLNGSVSEAAARFEANRPVDVEETKKQIAAMQKLVSTISRYESELAKMRKDADARDRQQVWKLLCEIPYGEMTTYGELGRKLEALEGKKTSARAVGGAVGHNPISILIPCHRVIGANGSLTGYAGGLERKIQLLKLEGISLEKLVQGK